jgi:ankyrin repeat protein
MHDTSISRETLNRLTPDDAVRLGDQALLNAMLDQGQDPQDALLVAAQGGQLDAARTLLDRGADANVADTQNDLTPLMLAASRGDVDMGHLLLDHGADPQAFDEQGFQAMDRAVLAGHRGFADMLVERGFDSPLGLDRLAASHEAPDRSPTLATDEAAQARELLTAVASGDAARAQACFEQGAQMGEGWTIGGLDPVHHAVAHGHTDMIHLLAEHEVDLNRTMDGQSPLYRAVDNSAGLDAETRNAVVDTLLHHGAQGALHLAIDKDETVARKIIDQTPAALGETQRQMDGDYDVGFSDVPALTHALREGKNGLARQMIEAGADVNARESETQRTPLTRTDDVDMSRLLIEHGADVNAQDRTAYGNADQAPLHFAVMSGNAAKVKLLLDNHADMTQPNHAGQTPEQLAAQHGSLGMVSAFSAARREQHADQTVARRERSAGLAR